MTFFACLFSPAVYCFMLISGYYGLKLKFHKVLLLCIVTFLSFTIGTASRWLLFNSIDWRFFLCHFLPISTKAYWFMTSYVMILIISPFINKGVKSLDRKNFKSLLCIMTILEVMPIITFVPNGGSNFFGLLYVYMLGRYFRRYNLKISSSWSILYFLLCLMLLWFVIYGVANLNEPNNKIAFRILSYNNPLIIIMSIMLFYTCINLRPWYSSIVNRMLTPTLCIYLITEAIGVPLYKFMADCFNNNLLCGLYVVFSVIIASLVTGHIIYMVARFIVNITSKFYNT